MAKEFDFFLQELAKVVHLSQLKADVQGACLILWKEGSVPLLFEYDDQLVPNTILLSSAITQIPSDYRDEIYDLALKENSRIDDTLSVKPDEEILYLHRRFHPEMQADDIEPILQKFLDTVKEWKKKVEEIIHHPPASQRPPPHPSAIQVFPYKA